MTLSSLCSADRDAWTMCQATPGQSVAVDCRGSSSMCAYRENKPKWADCSGSGPARPVQPKVITSTSRSFTDALKASDRLCFYWLPFGIIRASLNGSHESGSSQVFAPMRFFFFLFPPRWVHAWCLTEHTSAFPLRALRLPFLIFLGADRTVVHDGYARLFFF